MKLLLSLVAKISDICANINVNSLFLHARLTIRVICMLRISCVRFVKKVLRMVNARLCETAPPRNLNFLDCETKTPKFFKCKRETFSLLNLSPS